ncbi:hypothetical protein [Cyanobium sp. ATX-6F1]|uniref:hypothetical protein n=1 Tax=Cyanobium sp. ATX-6F1 TaxID=3137388 RepID=UPI0039BDC038
MANEPRRWNPFTRRTKPQSQALSNRGADRTSLARPMDLRLESRPTPCSRWCSAARWRCW